jgi:ribosomal-protein-alanine N-acetyltransferase
VIAYNLLPAARGHGYAAEAASAVTQWALENYSIPYIIGTVESGNIPSQRVLERCGFTFVDEKPLLVHIGNETHLYKYYRCYRQGEPAGRFK